MTPTQSLQPTAARRTPGPWASQPRVGQMMLAVVAGIKAAGTAGDAVFESGWANERYLLEETLSDLDTSQSFELHDLVSRRVAGLTCELARDQLRRDEEALVRELGLAGRRSRTLEQYLRVALRDASGPQRRKGALLLSRHQQVVGLRSVVRNSCLDAMLSAPVASAEVARDELRSRGFDAERIRWAVVMVEARRHVPLVLKEANRAARNWQGRGADGLIGYAWQGLRQALYNYDPSRGMFSTYACPRIRGAIRDGIRAESHLPKRLTTIVNKVERSRESLTQRLGRHPTQEEVARSVDMDLSVLSSMRHLGTPVSLDDLVEHDGGLSVVSTENPELAAIAGARRAAVVAALSSIDEEDATVIRLMVLEGVGVGECQERTGMSARQIRQRRERGLAQLGGLLLEWAE
jgi:RNA polymerase sigma factor for flagellar operon FliA